MNIVVQQMAQATLDEPGTPPTFWGEATFVATTILNRENVRVNNTQTPHELWYGNTPTVKYFKVFGRKCYIKRTNEKISKFEPRADKGVLLGYSSWSKGYKCYNKRLGKIVESIYVVVDEACKNPNQIKTEDYDNEEDGDYFPTSNHNDIEEETNEAPKEEIMVEEKTMSRYVQKNHPETQILGEKEASVQTRRTITET